MDYFVVEGHKDAAEAFSAESGIVPDMDLPSMEVRIATRDALLQGDVVAAMEITNELNPEILDTSPLLFFHMQQLRMIELLRTEELDEALLFASEHLAPLGEEHPHLLSELEQTMSLFVFDMRSPTPAMPAYATELYDTEYRKRVAEELNAAILASQSYSPTARLARLAHLFSYGQQLLGPDGPGKTDFPRLDLAGLLSRSLPNSREEAMTTEE